MKNFFFFFCRTPGGPGRSSAPPSTCYSSEDVISCQLTRSVQCAHQKPITVLRAAAGRVVTGSQDHTVRVTTSTRLLTTNLSKNPPTYVVSNTSSSSSAAFCQIYRLEDSCCLFTLQGHSGGITAIYIDQVRILLPVSKINSKLKLLQKKANPYLNHQ